MDTFFTFTSGRTRVQSSLSSSSSNLFIGLRGVPVRYWPALSRGGQVFLAYNAAIEGQILRAIGFLLMTIPGMARPR
jgi:hypothetical protein